MIPRITYVSLTLAFCGGVSLLLGRIAHLSYASITLLAAGLACYLLMTNPLPADPANASLHETLEAIRAEYKLPALAGALFTTDKVLEMAAVGVRKAGTTVPVTTDDLWHLGSDTKMMTAMLAGTFVDEKKLSWDDKVVSFFPDVAEQAPEAMRTITLRQVLGHQAGLKENLDWRALALNGSLTEQRALAAQLALSAPAFAPGTYHYANTDYVVIGAVLEKISGKSWEELIQQRVFQPLGMESAGFGGLGTVGLIDQPWPHLADGLPVDGNGPLVDNPEMVGPAGTVHCTMNDWAKFLIDQLRGGAGMPALLPPAIYQAMQKPAASAQIGYGYGWSLYHRPWAGGLALNHNGSNNLNFSVCWLAPAKKFGVLVCCNQGGAAAEKACDDVATALIQRYQARK